MVVFRHIALFLIIRMEVMLVLVCILGVFFFFFRHSFMFGVCVYVCAKSLATFDKSCNDMPFLYINTIHNKILIVFDMLLQAIQ